MTASVAVVGGGPAGSATALRLARAGIDVTLIERARFPRRKVCGEYQNCGAVESLDRLGLLEAVRAAAHPIRGIRLLVPDAVPVELRFPRPALACDRAVLDGMLLDAAAAAGTCVVRGRAESLLFDRGRAAGVAYRDEAGDLRTIAARFVVGADGTASVVARKLGLALPPRGGARFAIGGHYGGFGDLDGWIEMYAGGGAYFAINPLSAACANVMVVVPRRALAAWSADVDGGVRAKAAELGRGRRSFAAVERIGPRVSIGPLAHRVRAPVAPGAVLVGDAAGLLDPFTGQGVYLALAGAEAAADALIAAVRDRAAEAAALARYAAQRTADFRARRMLCALVTLLVDVAPLGRRVARGLPRRSVETRTLVDALAGIVAPQGALRADLLGRLLV